ncbi:MAG: hypothetical protein WC501_03035 [Candidatus Micrarchaeia archaeon]
MGEEVFALSDGRKQLSHHLLNLVDSLNPDFKKSLELKGIDPIPESMRTRINFSKNLFSYGKYLESLSNLQGTAIIFSGISNNDLGVLNTYNLVSSDDFGREFFLSALESKDLNSFYQKYYDFSSYVISRDLNRIGAGAKKSIFGDYFTAMENFIYLGLKTAMLSKIISDGLVGPVKSILFCRTESELKEICRRNYLSSEFNSGRFQLEKDHAGIQNAISERFDISPILSMVGLEILEDKKLSIPTVVSKSKNGRKIQLKNIPVKKFIAKTNREKLKGKDSKKKKSGKKK